jgi:hypothetical protein
VAVTAATRLRQSAQAAAFDWSVGPTAPRRVVVEAGFLDIFREIFKIHGSGVNKFIEKRNLKKELQFT